MNVSLVLQYPITPVAKNAATAMSLQLLAPWEFLGSLGLQSRSQARTFQNAEESISLP